MPPLETKAQALGGQTFKHAKLKLATVSTLPCCLLATCCLEHHGSLLQGFQDVFSGAGELPWRLVFSCVCAGMVPFAPAVGVVLAFLRLVHWWHAVWFDVCVVSSLAACIVPWLGGCFLAPRAVLLACVGGLAFLVRVCLRWLPALVTNCLCMLNHHISL